MTSTAGCTAFSADLCMPSMCIPAPKASLVSRKHELSPCTNDEIIGVLSAYSAMLVSTALGAQPCSRRQCPPPRMQYSARYTPGFHQSCEYAKCRMYPRGMLTNLASCEVTSSSACAALLAAGPWARGRGTHQTTGQRQCSSP